MIVCDRCKTSMDKHKYVDVDLLDRSPTNARTFDTHRPDVCERCYDDLRRAMSFMYCNWIDNTDAALIESARKEANGAVEAARERLILLVRQFVDGPKFAQEWPSTHRVFANALSELDLSEAGASIRKDGDPGEQTQSAGTTHPPHYELEAARDKVIEAARKWFTMWHDHVPSDQLPKCKGLYTAVRALDAIQQRPDEAVECQHEWDKCLYMSDPPKYKCRKCGQFYETSERRTGPKDRRKTYHHPDYPNGQRRGRKRRKDDVDRPICDCGNYRECRADAPKAVGDFGEPWTTDGATIQPVVYDNKDHWYATFGGLPTCKRAVACVNALAGKRPEKLAPLLEVSRAADRVLVEAGKIGTAAVLRDALAAFEGDTNG